MSSDFSLPLSEGESAGASGERLIDVREVINSDGLKETIYVWRSEAAEHFTTYQFDVRERVFLSERPDGDA